MDYFVTNNEPQNVMNFRNDNLIQQLYDDRKEATRRIHEKYVSAMELRTSDERVAKQIISTILSDLPEDPEATPHNLD